MNLLNPGIRVQQLCDERLLQEATAIDEIFELVSRGTKKLKAAHDFTFTPPGHYHYFINKLAYVEIRQLEIWEEVHRRRLHCGDLFRSGLPYEWSMYPSWYNHWRPTPYQVSKIERRYFLQTIAQSSVFYGGEEISSDTYFNLIYSQINSHNYVNQKADGSDRSIDRQNVTLRTTRNPKNLLCLHRDQHTSPRYGSGYPATAS